ncbi:prolyl oligopeptidase family serine peptidase [candidate division GN15 bacterium]|nr:prolyl oligopeptidase family serine peptidase [candidate division GN15 bacterium]
MKCTKQWLALTAVLLFAVGAVAADLEPPDAKKVPVVDTIFGDVRVDNYFWMRERDSEDVLAYLEAENEYVEALMEPHEEFVDNLYQEIKSRIKETDLSVPVKDGDYYYYSRDEEGKQYKIHCRKKGSMDGEEEILLDVNKLAEGKEFMSVGTFQISPDQKLLAYSTDENGSERYDLHIKNLETGQIYEDVIPAMSGNAAWANDNKTLFYTMHDDAWRPYQLYRHVLGTDPAQDEMIYQEDDEKFWMGVGRTKSDEYLMIGIGSKTTDEYHYLDANDPMGEFRPIRPRETGVEYSVDHHGDRFLILTNEDAVNFKLMSTPVDAPTKDNWTEFLPYKESVKIDGIDVFKDYVAVYQREKGLQKIMVIDMATMDQYMIDFPEPAYWVSGSENPEFDSELLRFSYASMVTPKSVFDYNMRTRERELKKQREVLGEFNPEDYKSERIFATADDGTQVPISMVYRKGLQKNGENPLYLYGYGSYGASMDPWFSSSRLSLLNRGFIFAIPHIRGGGEMGRPWYEEGKLLKKMNTFTDLIDCAEHLIAEGYTSADRLVVSGGSAGGLLVGAVINMRPELFEVAVASVPFVDVMNTMLDASIPLTVVEYEEWGNPNVEEYYHYMNSYSPYDNVIEQDYPHIFIESSYNDTRVQYWEGTKWAAKLRDHNTGDSRIVLKTNMGAGHGGSSGRYDYLKDLAFEYAFVLDCLGMIE